jgi:hypothetical protein
MLTPTGWRIPGVDGIHIEPQRDISTVPEGRLVRSPILHAIFGFEFGRNLALCAGGHGVISSGVYGTAPSASSRADVNRSHAPTPCASGESVFSPPIGTRDNFTLFVEPPQVYDFGLDLTGTN